MWTRQCSTPLVQVLLTAILLNGVDTGRSETTCSATTTLSSSSVTCHFHKDVSKHKENFIVQFYYPSITSSPDNLLYCYWTDTLHCDKSIGVSFNEHVTDQVTVTSTSKADRQSGLYRCQLVPSNHVPSHVCNVTFVETEKTVREDDDRHDGNETALVLGVVSFVLVSLILIFICALGVVVFKFRDRLVVMTRRNVQTDAKPDRERNWNTQPTDSIELFPNIAHETAVHAKAGTASDTTTGVPKNRSRWQRFLAAIGIRTAETSRNKREKANEESEKEIIVLENEPAGASSSTAPNKSQPQTVPGNKPDLGQGGSKTGAPSPGPHKTPVPDTRPLQILVIGKVKTGKSLLANNIIGEDRFKVGTTWGRPVTKVPGEHTAKISGRDVKVVDTSGLSTLTKEVKQQEVNQWKEMTAAGPRVILFLVRCDKIQTADLTFFQEVKQLWGETSFCQQMTVVLTFADNLKNAPVEEAGDRTPRDKNLDKIISEEGKGCILVTNIGRNKGKHNFGELIVGKVTQQAQNC